MGSRCTHFAVWSTLSFPALCRDNIMNFRPVVDCMPEARIMTGGDWRARWRRDFGRFSTGLPYRLTPSAKTVGSRAQRVCITDAL
ncbi:hypothetical protein P168DRAFT_179926 [Aspergillus campestris IBT 28561]|uniref:Uncharacterized protein n=1 Tax=Aspergillus campestris (strain IBT 28561) TaxID=1392248 RepID=A0A2I1D029_ASPC2|nr:uncharacterized protein P168DRAFT_179926 [Aspergillus campestris IBT 28561]PKY03234.1 hypothetical protein P168DRAFT_179926 [Aspergillus campestris IBT 28561]